MRRALLVWRRAAPDIDVTPTPVPQSQFYAHQRGASLDQIRGLVPVGRRGTVEDIASAVCYLASDEAGYITGHAMVVDGGWRAK